MADEQNLEVNTPVVEADKADVTPAKRRKPSVSRKSRVDPSTATSKKAASATPAAKPRRYSESEKAEKLAGIESRIGEGATQKAAIKEAGISEQTFYQWKRSATPSEPSVAKPATSGDSLAELVALEAENQRLRALLADKLRAENEELRKRLGMP